MSNPNIQLNQQDVVERINRARADVLDAAAADVDYAVGLQEREADENVVYMDERRAEQRPVFTNAAPVDNLAELRAEALEQAVYANQVIQGRFDDQEAA